MYVLRYRLDSNIKLNCILCTFLLYQYFKMDEIDFKSLFVRTGHVFHVDGIFSLILIVFLVGSTDTCLLLLTSSAVLTASLRTLLISRLYEQPLVTVTKPEVGESEG